jgi:hypothetical protein
MRRASEQLTARNVCTYYLIIDSEFSHSKDEYIAGRKCHPSKTPFRAGDHSWELLPCVLWVILIAVTYPETREMKPWCRHHRFCTQTRFMCTHTHISSSNIGPTRQYTRGVTGPRPWRTSRNGNSCLFASFKTIDSNVIMASLNRDNQVAQNSSSLRKARDRAGS